MADLSDAKFLHLMPFPNDLSQLRGLSDDQISDIDPGAFILVFVWTARRQTKIKAARTIEPKPDDLAMKN